jgi:diguanylate cyclase (GGDEF)-like protein
MPRAALLVDLDRFGDVNAALGRAAGDELIRQFALRLRELAPIEHLCADEYLVLCDDVAGPWEARELAGRLRAAWAAPFLLGEEEIYVTASIGVAVGDDHDALLREAGAALQRAKHAGRGHVELYDDVLRAGALKRLRLERDFRRALGAGDIAVAYQPILDLSDGTPRGVEALARWTDPVRGPVSPAVFIPLAERCGLIDELGRLVLREACRQLAAWRAELPGAEELWLSVNVSALQIAGGELPGTVRDALRDAGLPPEALALEVTESALMEEIDAPGPVLALLRSLGVRILLDDFGTGYSSLGYLRRYPVDGLKLDRAFVDGVAHPGAAAVVEAIIAMATKLGLQLTAEGVETSEHAERLRLLGCRLGQGYMLARPLPADATRDVLAARLQSRLALNEY